MMETGRRRVSRLGRSFWRGVAVVGVTVLLGACAVPWSAQAPGSCPRVSVLADAAAMTRYKPGTGRDVLDVVYKAAYSGAQLDCDYDMDSDTRTGVLSVELQLAFEVERGPAGVATKADVSYFVAVIDASGQVMNKKIFTVPVEYRSGTNRGLSSDRPVHLQIPLKESQTGSDFQIYTGFQLTRDELSRTHGKK